jgi:chromosome segregation ATPase
VTVQGPDALKALEDALKDIRREEDDITRRLSRSAEFIARFREAESELCRQLAKLRLEPEPGSVLSGKLRTAEQAARAMLRDHGASIAQAEAELGDLDARLAALAAERQTETIGASEAEKRLNALAKTLTIAGADKTRQAAAELIQTAEASFRKAELAEADREVKGKPYRGDRLFMYLWDRGYGTKAYRPSRFAAIGDAWVARLVGYAEARANFALLNQLPMRLKEHAEAQKRAAEAALADIEAAEREALDKAGGKPHREALEKAQARLTKIDDEMVATEDRRDERAKALRQLAEGSDPAFSAAVNGLADALSREDTKALLALARETSTGADDVIVKKIDELRQRISDEDLDVREQKSRLRTLAARRRELEDIQFEFKKQRFDRPQSSFREDRLVGDALNGFLRGEITAADYWGQWKGSQDWAGDGGAPRGDRSAWPDQSFAGGGAPRRSGVPGLRPPFPWGGGPFGGGGNSGGFSRPRSGSSGTRTGGGFKTGGGF